jgi:hypothetical protein
MIHIVRTSLRGRTHSLPRLYSTTSYTDHSTLANDPAPYWRNLEPWKDVKTHEFLTYGWQVGQQTYAYRHMADKTRKPTQSNDRRSS